MRLPQTGKHGVADLIPLTGYKDVLSSLRNFADGMQVFLATDDPAAEQEITSAFPSGEHAQAAVCQDAVKSGMGL